MKQIQEFPIYDYETSVSVPDTAKGVGVIYSPAAKNIVVCFECESNTTYTVSRRFKKIQSWQEIPYNSKYCGSAIMLDKIDNWADFGSSLWHVYELL